VAGAAAGAGLDPETVANLTLNNVARLYEIDLDTVATPSKLIA
jgi:hypothetical protein